MMEFQKFFMWRSFPYLFACLHCAFAAQSTTSIICERSRLHLSCPVGTTLNIESALYGRKDRGTCPHGAVYTTDCSSPVALQKVKETCQGRKTCTLFSDNSVFGDPCPNTHKYLQVTYTCVACKYSKLGKSYSGTLSMTRSDKTCQRWDSQTPHQHTRQRVENFPDASLADASNYCRNPDNEDKGPWCYTTDPNTRWEFCDVQFCGCRTNKIGANYGGVKNITITGKTCQRWDSQSPHTHDFDDPANFPDDTLSDTQNFCRNPDNEPVGPWCYTMDANTRWESCGMPPCECKETKLGKSYFGQISTTRSGRTCQRWDSQSPHSHTRNDPNNFPDASLADAANYCRNPDDEPDGPWCYTTDAAKRWEYCDVSFCFFYKPDLPTPPPGTVTTECKYTDMGLKYKGRISVTRDGYECQRWDQQRPHRHGQEDPAMFPDRTLAEAENFCRNPDREPDGPWCYTTDPGVRWQFCNVPMCDCKDTKIGQEYKGRLAKTKSDFTCQRWDSQTPHSHSQTDPSKFPDPTLADAANYCRNPDQEPEGPWCYTTSSEPQWEYCDVPQCECKMDEEGGGYSGKINETFSKIPCQRWDQQYPHQHTKDNPNNFPEKDITQAENYCRNPDGENSGPWCYTLDPEKRWQYCDIPYCRTAKRPYRPPPPKAEGLKECKRTRMGFEYHGNMSVTSSGLTCQRWDSQTPHQHQMTDISLFPEIRLVDTANYCRNPSAYPLGPWCYTTNPTVTWEYCAIPDCDCRVTPKGKEYAGKTSVTQSGKACQRWDAMAPHQHAAFQDQEFPEKSVSGASNYCRNPTSAEKPNGPWCYTVEPSVEWEYCEILDCDCKLDTLGQWYKGHTDFTQSGRRCQRWDSQYPHGHSNNKLENFPDASLAEASNYCRNPDKEPEGPWCYTLDMAVRWEYCDVQHCAQRYPNITLPTPQGRTATNIPGGSSLGAGGIAGVTIGTLVLIGVVLAVAAFLLRGRSGFPFFKFNESSGTGLANPTYDTPSSGSSSA